MENNGCTSSMSTSVNTIFYRYIHLKTSTCRKSYIELALLLSGHFREVSEAYRAVCAKTGCLSKLHSALL